VPPAPKPVKVAKANGSAGQPYTGTGQGSVVGSTDPVLYELREIGRHLREIRVELGALRVDQKDLTTTMVEFAERWK